MTPIPTTTVDLTPTWKEDHDMTAVYKDYQVFYELKRNNRYETHHIFVIARNQKEAKKIAGEVVREKTGRHAFHLRFTPN